MSILLSNIYAELMYDLLSREINKCYRLMDSKLAGWLSCGLATSWSKRFAAHCLRRGILNESSEACAPTMMLRGPHQR